MMRAAFVTLKQYRFEVGLAVMASLVAAVLGFAIDVRIDALRASQDCLDRANASQVGPGDACFALVAAGSEILGSSYLSGDGTLQLSVMGVLPFVVGLLGGLPIVARELEDQTSQTAWWLYGSRRRWLVRQLGPIILILGVAIALAAFAATLVSEDWIRWYGGERAILIGVHGPLTVIRAFGALGVGLATGAVVGRVFTAFIASVTVLVVVGVFAVQAHEVWLTRLPQEPLWKQSAATGQWLPTGGEPRGVAWGAPDGAILTPVEARQRATDAGVPAPGPDDPQDARASVWLEVNGYSEITVGVTDEAAAGWAPFDAAIFGSVGVLGTMAAFVVVSRRRPF
jgi:hypothetical protein